MIAPKERAVGPSVCVYLTDRATTLDVNVGAFRKVKAAFIDLRRPIGGKSRPERAASKGGPARVKSTTKGAEERDRAQGQCCSMA
jgi:hypothetical protein